MKEIFYSFQGTLFALKMADLIKWSWGIVALPLLLVILIGCLAQLWQSK